MQRQSTATAVYLFLFSLLFFCTHGRWRTLKVCLSRWPGLLLLFMRRWKGLLRNKRADGTACAALLLFDLKGKEVIAMNRGGSILFPRLRSGGWLRP
ncbi:hypothetical protein EV126DRAFT_152544 [Verticillium dahliae]|nr:hypothetical protein EV126DRAFT_152544 [Verticillium dahliae]